MKLKLFLFVILAGTTFASYAEPNKTGGFFWASNDTNQTVTITVGNFFPTAYTIDPYSSKIVWVSTDNQNIHIKKISE